MGSGAVKKLFFFLLLSGQTLFASRSSAQYLGFNPEADSLILAGIYYIHRLELDSAVQAFDRIIEQYPEHPIGYFYKAGIYDIFNQDYRITAYEDEFEKYVNKAIKLGEKYIKKEKKDPLAYFYLGGAYGFRGLHRFYKRDWLRVFVDGYKGLKNLKTSLEIRPDFYDAYFGLGLYHYWRSAMTKKLRFLPFISDQRQQGINELKLAIEKGRYAEVESRIALASIYYNEARYDSALQMNTWLHQRFPEDPAVLYLRARIFEKTGQWEKVLETINRVYNIITNYPYQSIGYQIECHYWRAVSLNELGKKEEAFRELETALALKSKRNPRKELEGPNEDFDEIFKRAIKLHKQLSKELTDSGR